MPIGAHHLLMLGLPLWMLGAGMGGAFIAVSYVASGLYMGAVFAPNHLGMPLLEPRAGSDAAHAERPPLQQAAHTRNVRLGALGAWLWGGLNLQIEHHLLPSVSRLQLHAAQPLVRELCERNAIAYTSVPPLQAWRDVLCYLHAVGAPLRGQS